MKAINYTQKFVLVTVAVLGAAACAPGAHADDFAVGVASRTVHYADLNVTTDAGAKVLMRRLRTAAEQVCGDVDSRQLDQAAAANACVDKAIVAGVRQVNSAQLMRAAKAHGYDIPAGIKVASIR